MAHATGGGGGGIGLEKSIPEKSSNAWAWKSLCCACVRLQLLKKTNYRQLCLFFSAASQQHAKMYRQAASLEKLAAQEMLFKHSKQAWKSLLFLLCVRLAGKSHQPYPRTKIRREER